MASAPPGIGLPPSLLQGLGEAHPGWDFQSSAAAAAAATAAAGGPPGRPIPPQLLAATSHQQLAAATGLRGMPPMGSPPPPPSADFFLPAESGLYYGAAEGGGGDRALPPSPYIDSIALRVQPILNAVSQQSQRKVSAEIRMLEAGLSSLAAKAHKVEALLRLHERSSRPLPRDGVLLRLQEVERHYDQSLVDLKRELHQTIIAHNHNADLMADHKAEIDKMTVDLGASQMSLPSQQQQEQLEKAAEALERNQLRDRDVEFILARGEALFQRSMSLGFMQTPGRPSTGATVAQQNALRSAMGSSGWLSSGDYAQGAVPQYLQHGGDTAPPSRKSSKPNARSK
mmetsp:Transcript_57575/g.136927  ORF Transcript_57575/g.136927 Transcript_57575/m.136927 type:complete len:342 (-) Transcript_57575:105-1130(-)|eukprot:CAMPEP_0178425190 /NCGR_PEP_ID=MMETSP0689_2-20121128/28595_1 /TAXON_ID=160604 /ORGANISM="Amphidinium massartii, Strain CS-259" /LENGTH=341 /DNA_ID=CAMNT_0020046845 /DNA_START=103 /DNA_END=1128 /DNA_ORIENTATION=-